MVLDVPSPWLHNESCRSRLLNLVSKMVFAVAAPNSTTFNSIFLLYLCTYCKYVKLLYKLCRYTIENMRVGDAVFSKLKKEVGQCNI